MNKKIINIIFLLIAAILLTTCIFINKDYSVIFNKKNIINKQTLNRYNDYKFVTIDLKNATETRFSLSDNDVNSIIYYTSFDNQSILIELSEHTVLTDSMDLMYMKDNSNILMLKNNIKEESEEDISFIKGYYTNVNLQKNTSIISIKFYINIALLIISFILIVINFVSLLSKNDSAVIE